MRKVYITLFLLSLLSLATKNALAQENELSLSITPSVTELTLDPGKTLNENILVTNNGSTQTDVTIYATTFIPAGNNGMLSFQTFPTDAAFWFSFQNKLIQIPPNKGISVPIKISIPQSTKSGGYYVSVFFQKNTSGNSISIEPRIGSLFLISIPGKLITSANIQSFNVSQPAHIPFYPFFNGGRLEFNQLVQNTGSIHIHLVSNIEITNIFGQKMKDVAPQEHILLPNETLSQNTNWDMGNFLFGYFHAKETVSNGTNILASKTISFWIIPLWISILFIFILILIILFRIYISKHKRKGSFKYINV